MDQFNALQTNLAKYGQSHLLHFWDELADDEKNNLVKRIADINLEEVVGYFEKARKSLTEDVAKLDDRMQPMPDERCGSVVETRPDELQGYRMEGLKRVANGEVGVLLMAGGQGTRLGVSYPKGMYSVGLLSGKTLFQIQAERIQKLQRIAAEATGQTGRITWYIMTSEYTIKTTKDYLVENNYFRLDPNDVVLFEQGKLPCFDFNGKILMAEKYDIAQAPDGNGGLYRALRDKRIIEDMRKRGVRLLHAHSVDNVLVQVADPVFIGYCVQRGADCAAKVVHKVEPTEAIGVVCTVDDLYQVVEYSEITDRTAQLRNGKGTLVFCAGNICNHFFTTDFLERVGNEFESQLKLHVAKKKIGHICLNSGMHIKPMQPNGIKIEKFVFDVFQFAEKFVTWEVPRDVEFSALKNSDDAGKDCPKTARADLYKLHKRYVEDAGGEVDGDEVEISPFVSYAGEGLEELVQGKKFVAPLLLHSDNEAGLS